MTTAPLPVSAVRPERDRLAWLGLKQAYAAVAIAAMWIAVLFTGVFGPDLVSQTVTDNVTVPSVIPVAFFAFLATVPVAMIGFRSER